MRPPSGVLGITLDNDGIFVECVGQGQSRLRLLPRIEIIGLFASEPVGKGSPDILNLVSVRGFCAKVVENALGTMTSLLCLMRSSRMVNGAVSTSTSLQ